MGTGGFSWDRGVGVAVGGWWWFGKNQTWFQFRQRSGANTQPKSGVSIQSQLVWLYHMQDIYFKQFVCIFLLSFCQLSLLFSFNVLFLFFVTIWLSWALAGAAGCNFLGKQRNGTGEFSQYTYSLPFSLSSGSRSASGKPVSVRILNHTRRSGSWHV